MSVSSVTANKLLQGEFKTFEELETEQLSDLYPSTTVNILYRRVENAHRKGLLRFIIETIFIDE